MTSRVPAGCVSSTAASPPSSTGLPRSRRISGARTPSSRPRSSTRTYTCPRCPGADATASTCSALRVRGHGLPRADGYGRGNLVVRIQIEVPKQVSGEQREALESFDAVELEKSKKARRKSIFEKVKDIFQ